MSTIKNDWWKNESNFNEWDHKTKRYPVYDEQKEELTSDIKSLIDGLGGKPTILDVGGGNNRLELPNVKVIDIQDGFDITKDWKKQGLTKKYDIVITSLTLIVFDEETVEFIVKQMRKHAKKYIYIYEETWQSKECGVDIAEGASPKYSHVWVYHLGPATVIKPSAINPRWIRMFFEL